MISERRHQVPGGRPINGMVCQPSASPAPGPSKPPIVYEDNSKMRVLSLRTFPYPLKLGISLTFVLFIVLGCFVAPTSHIFHHLFYGADEASEPARFLAAMPTPFVNTFRVVYDRTMPWMRFHFGDFRYGGEDIRADMEWPDISCPHPFLDRPIFDSTGKRLGDDEFNCLVSDKFNISDADICVRNARKPPRSGREGSCVTVGYGWEGKQRFKHVGNAEKDYDTSATYMSSSTFPMPHVHRNRFAFNHYFPGGQPAPPVLPLPERSASFIAKNCYDTTNRRADLVKFLMKHIPVRSLGDCLRNTDWPDDSKANNTLTSKVAVLERYALSLALENQNEEDYVSEKVFQALQAGVIPVYLGAPNIYDYVPSKDSIINVRDFKSRDDLAKHLKDVLSNDTLLMSYHEWRYKPLPQEFLQRLQPYKLDLYCRLCHYAYAQKNGFEWNRTRQTVEVPAPPTEGVVSNS